MEAHIEEIKQKILPILRRHGVAKAAVFGSFVRGENKEGSDLDLLVEFEGEKKSSRSRWSQGRVGGIIKNKSRCVDLRFPAPPFKR